MGCCASRPADADESQYGGPAPPQIRNSANATTSQTAINPIVQDRPPRPLEPPSATSLNHSETSRSALSTSRRSSINRSRSPQVGLADHYNLPLEAPKPWTSKEKRWTREQLSRERYEFFETRVTGRREIWDALGQVAESVRDGDIPTAQGILDAVGVTLPTGRIDEGGYDEAGNLYRIPEAVLSDPTNVAENGDGDEQTVVGATETKDSQKSVEGSDLTTEITEKSRVEKGKAAVAKDAVKVKCRLSDRGGPDVVVLLGKTQIVSVLIAQVRDEADVPSAARVRVAYLGRILDEKSTLSSQGWKEGHTVNILVSGIFSG